MSTYRIYYVTTGKPKPGKAEVAARWWAEKGRKAFESKPGTKSVRAYITQSGLSGDAFPFEIWQEIESFAALDQWAQKTQSDPPWHLTLFTEFFQYYDLGPCRIMGDWPECCPGVGAT